jgi:hypothetical protein
LVRFVRNPTLTKATDLCYGYLMVRLCKSLEKSAKLPP